MPKQATNSSVSEIEVEIDRPVDQSGKKDQNRSDAGTVSITGTGGSGTVITNNSEGAWYLEQVSAHAPGASEGTVQVLAQVRNSGGTVKAEQLLDGAGGFVPFGGQIVKSGWDVHAVVSQSDSGSYTVDIRPLFRKPNPVQSTTGGGGGGGDSTSIVDDFEDNDLSEYSGDTGAFSTTSTRAYQGTYSLQASSQTAFARIISTDGSGLESYPQKGTTFECYMTSDVIGTTDPHRSYILFGVGDSSNYYSLRFNWEGRNDVVLFKQDADGGTSGTLFTESAVEDFTDTKWHRVEVTWDDGTLGFNDNDIVVTVYNPSGTEIGSWTANDSEHADNVGAGFAARLDDTDNHVGFDKYEVTEGL